VVLHPVQRGRAADQVEAVRRKVEQDRVADHVAVVIARDKLLRRVDAEVVERVDAEPCEHLERVAAFDVEVRHVVRLIEQRAGLTPRTLLVAPVSELARHDRERVRPDLRVAQHVDRALRGPDRVFETLVRHGRIPPSAQSKGRLALRQPPNDKRTSRSPAQALPVRQPSA
jgi:hypothetical protein